MGNCDQYPSCGPASQSAPAEPHWTLPGWPHGIPAALFLRLFLWPRDPSPVLSLHELRSIAELINK